MSAFQPYRRPFPRVAPATLATFATVHVPEPRSVASVANVAGPQSETDALLARNVATVASVAGVEAETGSTSPDTPAGWREALLALSPDHDPCTGFRPGAWARVWAGALDFIERHGDGAHGLGWTAQELFGVHPVVGVIRVDFTGALLLTVAGRVLAVEVGLIRYAIGLAFHRAFCEARVPIWAFLSRP